MLRRITNRYNIVPFVILPAGLWGFDLVVHMMLSSNSAPKVWITLLSIAFPIIGFILVAFLYSFLTDKLSDMLPPEFTGVIGLLLAQPIYMLLLKLFIDGHISFSPDEWKGYVYFYLYLPLSTITFSTYDGTLLALPLACMAMFIAGARFRRKLKNRAEHEILHVSQ